MALQEACGNGGAPQHPGRIGIELECKREGEVGCDDV
jgi:hypothetical protein